MPKKSRKKHHKLVKAAKHETNPGRIKHLLEEWFAEPDDLGEEFWEKFDKELRANRFSIP